MIDEFRRQHNRNGQRLTSRKLTAAVCIIGGFAEALAGIIT